MGMVYIVTSPLHKDDHVEAFQRALHKHGWYDGPIDGIYGQLTSQAVYRAKYWLGYPDHQLNHAAGDLLYSYLTGKKPALGMNRLAAKRKSAAAKAEPIRLKMLTEALKHVGYKESPAGTNRNQFGEWYHANGVAWCNEFVSYCGVKAGSKAFSPMHNYAYVPYMVGDARRGHNYLTITINPKPGDCVTYDWPGESKGTADHVGLFMHWIDITKGTFAAIEGNTAIGNNSNGGEVMIRTDRVKSEVQVFIHIGG